MALEVFSGKGRLFLLDGRDWNDMGVGTISLTRMEDTAAVRFELTSDEGQVLAKHTIRQQAYMEPHAESTRALIFKARDELLSSDSWQTFAVRFKSSDAASDFALRYRLASESSPFAAPISPRSMLTASGSETTFSASMGRSDLNPNQTFGVSATGSSVSQYGRSAENGHGGSAASASASASASNDGSGSGSPPDSGRSDAAAIDDVIQSDQDERAALESSSSATVGSMAASADRWVMVTEDSDPTDPTPVDSSTDTQRRVLGSSSSSSGSGSGSGVAGDAAAAAATSTPTSASPATTTTTAHTENSSDDPSTSSFAASGSSAGSSGVPSTPGSAAAASTLTASSSSSAAKPPVPATAVRLLRRTEFVVGKGFITAGGATTHKELASILRLSAGQSVLDVGCGLGGPALHLASSYAVSVVGLDIDPDVIHAAQRYAEDYTTAHPTPKLDVVFKPGSVAEEPLAEEHFDAVFSREVLGGFDDKAQVLDRVFAAVKPGGRILVSDTCRGPSVSAGSKDMVTTAEVGKLLADAGFQDVLVQDRTDQYISALEADVEALRSKQAGFVDAFSVVEFEELETEWMQALRRAYNNEEKWAVCVGRKPRGSSSSSSAAAASKDGGVGRSTSPSQSGRRSVGSSNSSPAGSQVLDGVPPSPAMGPASSSQQPDASRISTGSAAFGSGSPGRVSGVGSGGGGGGGSVGDGAGGQSGDGDGSNASDKLSDTGSHPGLPGKSVAGDDDDAPSGSSSSSPAVTTRTPVLYVAGVVVVAAAVGYALYSRSKGKPLLRRFWTAKK